MNSVDCYLICYTSWGGVCYRGEKKSVSSARKDARNLKSMGYCFSYIVYDKDKKKILAKG